MAARVLSRTAARYPRLTRRQSEERSLFLYVNPATQHAVGNLINLRQKGLADLRRHSRVGLFC